MGKTLILIDGHALAFRQYYALERTQMKTTDGKPTWAVYGFFKSVFDLLKNKKLKADAIAVAFDVSHVTFRTEKYTEYKSNRRAMPDDMQAQMKFIYDGLEAFNIPIYTKQGYEADDVIGTISKQACDLGHNVLILTGDQDAFQLVDKEGCVKVILPSKGELIEYNWDKIYEKLGVYPNQVVDYKGLRGDTSDCIPGVKGIGEKTAQKLLAQYGTLEDILANCEDIPEKSVREKICLGKDSAKLSQELATIIRDLDIDFNFENAKINLPQIEKVTKFLKKLQFHTFIKNIDAILSTFDKEIPEVNRIQPILTEPARQLGLFTETVTEEFKSSQEDFPMKLITDNQDLYELTDKLKNSSIFTFKVYADFVNAVNSEIAGIGISFNKDFQTENNRVFSCNQNSVSERYYIPLFHTNMSNQLRFDDVINCLKPVLENEDIKKITFDAKNQCNILRNVEVNIKGIVFDVMLASYIKDSSRKHDLDIQGIEYLNRTITSYGIYEKKDPPKIKTADREDVINHVSDELCCINDLTNLWLKKLDNSEINLLYNIELPLAFILADMEYIGVTVDIDYLSELTQSMDKELENLKVKIYDLAGTKFNINSPKQVSETLFGKLGLNSKKKTNKKSLSTSAAVLEELAENYEIAEYILEYRKYSKLKSTYTETLPTLVDKKDGRIHTTYNQTVTTTGRLSSSNPNLQNIPSRTEDGNKIRNAFVPKDRENCLILSADYSQVELRLLAHISNDKNMCEAFRNNDDIHTLIASEVFEVPVEDVSKEMRYQAKAVNFGIVYGQSKYGLAKSLGIETDEAEDFIDKYFATYPMIKAYMEKTRALVEKKGYVETIFGRKRYLAAELKSSNGMIREFAKRAAINQPIQGTAADVMKIAMIDFAKKLKENNLNSKMIMQVHDEIVVEMYKNEEEIVKRLVKESMELSYPLSVPLVVDIRIGETWKE